MYNAFDRPLLVELKNSRLLGTVWLTLHGLATAGVVSLALDWRTRLALTALLALHAWAGYCLHIALSLPASVCALAWDRQQGWRIRQQRGGWHAVELCLPVLVTCRLAALRVRLGRFRHASILVVADRTAADDFRRLRVRLIQSAHGDRDRKKIPGSR